MRACTRENRCYIIEKNMIQPTLDILLPTPSAKRKPRLQRHRKGASYVVFLNEYPVYQYACDDSQASRHVAVQLSFAKYATQQEIADLWGVDKRTIANWRDRYTKSGIDGLADNKAGRPRTVVDEDAAEILSLRNRGLKLTEIAEELQFPIGTVRTIIYSRMRDQLELFDSQDDNCTESAVADETLTTDLEADETLIEMEELGDTDPLDRSLDRMAAVLGLIDDADPIFADCDHVEGAGSLLAIALLSQDPFLDKVKAAYCSIGPAFYGLRTIFVTLFLMAVLRIKNPERNGKRNPLKLGRLLGLDRGPSIKTIRRKIHTLSNREKALEVMHSLGEHRIAETGLPDAVLYVDGHVKCYYGNGTVGKTFSTAKNRVVKGETDYWLNLGDGTPILCLPSELNDSMSTMLLRVIEDAKKISGGKRITVVFDRGGSSAATYEKIIKAGCDFIAYHKNPKKLDPSEFPLGPALVNGSVYAQVPVSRHIELEVYCRSGKGKYKKTGRKLKIREVILLRDNDGGQTSVVTSREDLTTIQVLEAIFIRWSQENCFKYLLEEYAFDHLCIYGTEELREEHDRPNPEYAKLGKTIARLRSKLAQDLSLPLEKLAEELAEDSQGKMGSILTDKRKALLQAHIDRIAELKERQSKIPERIKPENLRRLPQESRMVMNLVKMTAYIIEGKLASILKRLHSCVNGNERGICSGFFQSTGALKVIGRELHITLEPQGDPKRTQLLSALCDQVNALDAEYPGTSLKMVFEAENWKF